MNTSACASSANAIGDACYSIALGKSDMIITGGTESAITELGIGGFNAMRALSTRNDDPERASRPFDKDRDGFVMGEGAATLVLESLDHAKARGARIYAEIVGVGMSADTYHIAAPDPNGKAAMLSMESALRSGNMKPEDIDYINTHGTSTPLGDISECRAIEKLFGDHAPKMAINSTKSMIGHLLRGKRCYPLLHARRNGPSDPQSRAAGSATTFQLEFRPQRGDSVLHQCRHVELLWFRRTQCHIALH